MTFSHFPFPQAQSAARDEQVIDASLAAAKRCAEPGMHALSLAGIISMAIAPTPTRSTLPPREPLRTGRQQSASLLCSGRCTIRFAAPNKWRFFTQEH